MKLTEFYLEKQGRPDSKVSLDMETRAPSIPPGAISGIMLQASYTTLELTNNYTAAEVSVILADASAGPVTITLPEAVSSAGKYYYIKKVDASSNVVKIVPDVATELIDGESELRIRLQFGYVSIVCSGVVVVESFWHIIGGVSVKLEDVLETTLQDQTSILHALLEELKEARLHLASLSDANVEDADV